MLSGVMVAWAGNGWEIASVAAAAAAADALEKMDLRSSVQLGLFLSSSFFNVYLDVNVRGEKVGTLKACDVALKYANSSIQILLIVSIVVQEM